MDAVSIATLAAVVLLGVDKLLSRIGFELKGIRHITGHMQCSKCMSADLSISRRNSLNKSTTPTPKAIELHEVKVQQP